MRFSLTSRRSQPPWAFIVPPSRALLWLGGGSALVVRHTSYYHELGRPFICCDTADLCSFCWRGGIGCKDGLVFFIVRNGRFWNRIWFWHYCQSAWLFDVIRWRQADTFHRHIRAANGLYADSHVRDVCWIWSYSDANYLDCEAFCMRGCMPNQSPEPAAVGAYRSANAGFTFFRRWLSFGR